MGKSRQRLHQEKVLSLSPPPRTKIIRDWKVLRDRRFPPADAKPNDSLQILRNKPLPLDSLVSQCLHFIALNFDLFKNDACFLPQELADAIFYFAMDYATIQLTDYHKMIHNNTLFLDFRNFGEVVTDKTMNELVIPQLKEMDDVDDWTEIDTHFDQFCLGCPKLRTLCLKNCSKINNFTLKSVLSACQYLTNVDLSHCINLTNLVIASPYLEILDISFTSGNFQINSPNLRSLNCGNCREWNFLTCIDASRKLENLDIPKFSMANFLNLIEFVRNCNSLKNLNVSDSRIGSGNIQDLLLLNKSLKIESLNLSETLITIEIVDVLVREKTSLRTIDLSRCNLLPENVEACRIRNPNIKIIF